MAKSAIKGVRAEIELAVRDERRRCAEILRRADFPSCDPPRDTSYADGWRHGVEFAIRILEK